MNNCPQAMPAKKAVKVNWIIDAEALKSRASCGNAARYMSIEKGATALSSTSTAISILDGDVNTSVGTFEFIERISAASVEG